MTIYKLEQVTWKNGTMSDYDLPKDLGHYLHKMTAIGVRNNVMPIKGYNELWCSDLDYRITAIKVNTEG